MPKPPLPHQQSPCMRDAVQSCMQALRNIWGVEGADDGGVSHLGPSRFPLVQGHAYRAAPCHLRPTTVSASAKANLQGPPVAHGRNTMSMHLRLAGCMTFHPMSQLTPCPGPRAHFLRMAPMSMKRRLAGCLPALAASVLGIDCATSSAAATASLDPAHDNLASWGW